MHVVTLVRRESNRWRFWEATIDGPLIEIATGPVGSEGDADYQQFASAAAAFAWLENAVAQRRAEGYVDPDRKQDVAELGAATVARNAELEEQLQGDPDDVDTYLVYADWLESAGDPRGRLISLHHRLETDPDNAELTRAESELLLHYADHFFPEHGERSALEAQWRLGFISRAVIGTVESLHRLLVHPSSILLRELHVGGLCEREAFSAAIIAGGLRPTLRQVRFSVSDGEPLPESMWARLPGLEEVVITGSAVLDGADTARWTKLEIEGESSELIELLTTPRWPALRELSVALSDVDEEDLFVLLQSAALPALRELTLTIDPELLGPLGRSPLVEQLEVLRLRDCDLTDDEVDPLLAQRGALSHLRLLDVSNNYLSVSARELFKSFPIHVVTAPQNDDDDEFDDDYYDDYGDYGSDDLGYDEEQFSADVVPVYEKDPDELEDDGALAIDKTWQRGVVGFDHDDE